MNPLKSLMIGAVVALALALAQMAQAEQIDIPSDLATVTNGATFTSTSGLPLTLPRDKDIGVFIKHNSLNTGTSNTIYGFDFQIGTNWTATAPLRLTLACTGTTANDGYFYISRTNFTGVNAIRFGRLSTTQLTNVTPSSIAFDWTH